VLTTTAKWLELHEMLQAQQLVAEVQYRTRMPADVQIMVVALRNVHRAGALSCSLTSSAANFNTAVNGASSGTLKLQYTFNCHQNAAGQDNCRLISSLHSFTYTLNGSLGSDVRVILNVTFDLHASREMQMTAKSCTEW